jgi:VanZ family protein
LNSDRKQVIKTWIAAILWLILIAFESTDWLSSANTGRFLYPVLHYLTGVDPIRFLVWNYYIRKAGHVAGYFGLSLLLYRAWHATIPLGHLYRWSIQWSRISFFMTALVACLDEWHQTYLASRTGSLQDVLLDTTAAFAAQVAIFIWAYVHGSTGQQSDESVVPEKI